MCAPFRMGAILIGTIVSAALLGVAYVQMFYYFVGKLRVVHCEAFSIGILTCACVNR